MMRAIARSSGTLGDPIADAVKACRRGNDAAVDVLYRAAYTPAVARVRQSTGDAHLAEDAAAFAVARANERIDELDEPSSFVAWTAVEVTPADTGTFQLWCRPHATENDGVWDGMVGTVSIN